MMSVSVPLRKRTAIKYEWDFGGHTVEPSQVTTTGSITVTPKTTAPETITLRLIVTTDKNENNIESPYMFELTVAPSGTPVAITPPQTALMQPTTFFVGDKLDVYAFIPLATGQSIKMYEWSFSGGMKQLHYTTADTINKVAVEVKAEPNTPGDYTLTITAITQDFQQIVKTFTYTITAAPPP
ncbi:MAG: hypothetical protein M3R04_00740 [bacterium]|nr:hypothetical protein [bacterium]